ncbi:MAG: asparagine synthase (glutamine-hydrolyzing) [Candidatus Tectimicrobiota bacterium]
MCGLSAILTWDDGQDLPSALLRMHAQIPHRGPDGEGFAFVDQHYRATPVPHTDAVRSMSAPAPLRLGYGFRWLQIQDRSSTGAQPMQSHDGSLWLIFNGEIYNFQELRAELQHEGQPFRSQSDSEVILAAYQRWGTQCFARFCGMWAIVLADLRSRRVIISRDRFGIKPLFYAFEGQQLRLASEIKQLLAASRQQKPANLRLVSHFLQGVRLHHGEETFFTGIMAVPPATYASIDLTTPACAPLQFQPYWQLATAIESPARPMPSFPEACALFEELLRTTVAAHSVAQVPLGCLLSGGLDSSTLAALLRAGQAPSQAALPSFSLVMRGYPDLDESPHIHAVCRHLKLPNFQTTLDAAWLQAQMATISWTHEEPLIGPAWVAQYCIYRYAASHGMRVILDGQGADEFLAGYPRHQYALWHDRLSRKQFGALGQELACLIYTNPSLLFEGARRLGQRLCQRWREQHRGSQEYAWLSRDMRADDTAHPPEAPASVAGYPHSRLHQMLAYDIQYGNLKTVLAVGDRNSMAHAIESRVPYLDHRLIEFAFQVPEHYKIGRGLRKRLLRRVAARYLPARVVYRGDRIGFGLPVSQWLRDDLYSTLQAIPSASIIRDAALFERPKLTAFIERADPRQAAHAAVLWRLYALWQWAETYQVALR